MIQERAGYITPNGATEFILRSVGGGVHSIEVDVANDLLRRFGFEEEISRQEAYRTMWELAGRNDVNRYDDADHDAAAAADRDGDYENDFRHGGGEVADGGFGGVAEEENADGGEGGGGGGDEAARGGKKEKQQEGRRWNKKK
jgi:hypothetical protein